MAEAFDVPPEHALELALGRILDESPAPCFRCWTDPDLIVR